MASPIAHRLGHHQGNHYIERRADLETPKPVRSALAYWTGSILGAVPFEEVSHSLSASPDSRVLAFTIGLMIITALLFGLTPALWIDQRLYVERIIADGAVSFGFVAALLAGIGLYSVVAYSVEQRTKEIGVRIALAATRGDLVWMVVKDIARIMTFGTLAGVGGCLILGRLVESLLYGVSAPRIGSDRRSPPVVRRKAARMVVPASKPSNPTSRL